MSARRLVAAAVAFAWLLPTLVAGAVALHVAFEHPAEPSHHGAAEPIAALTVAGPAHLQSTSQTPHEHSTVCPAADPASRRALDSAAHAAAVGAAQMQAHRIEAASSAPRARTLAGPPKASGPPLLARLSTFRI